MAMQDGNCRGDEAVRYAPSLLGKAGCFYPLGVASSLVSSGLPAVLEASNPVFFDCNLASGHHDLLGRSLLQVHIDEFGVPTGVAINMSMASLEASSSRRGSASSCELCAYSFQGRRAEWWLRLVAGDGDDREILAKIWM
ncbi:hypothetical protein BS78_08G155900 [Paspalum vaginatum]|nr:hypothetical protein BS78_08G155900 [Paspalum vaginatum]